jgi:glycosyltransferase involved in cell wall biosynthesis
VRVLVKAAFDTMSGYGNDGCGLVRALDEMGVETFLHPVQVTPPIPETIARRLMVALDPPFDAMIVHLDPSQLAVGRGVHRVIPRIIGWTMWEWESFRPSKSIVKTFEKEIQEFDSLLSYDQVSFKALDSHLPKDGSVQHDILQGGFWSEDWKYLERDWSGTFRFCMVGQLHQRKNPFAAISAFDQLKQEHGDEFDAELHLKTNIGGLHPAMEDRYEGLKIHYAYWPREKLVDFYRKSHCMISTSFGEGKNIPAMEAMTTGIPVIATNFGGHTVWLSDEYAYPLDWEPHISEMGLSAKADVEHLKKLMWHVYTNRDEAREKGRIASRTIPAMSDWGQVARKLVEHINRMPARDLADPVLL